MSAEDGWRLYALSRVIELLMLSFQHGTADGTDWPGPGIAIEEVCTFARGLGLTVVSPDRYSPFDCEIVTATPARDPHEPPSLIAVHWPCLMLGDMLICRAGTSIHAGEAIVNPEIATSSTLYWAYRRKNRPYVDRSQGWGSNSQWRTRFRRDYRVGDRLFYNVDGGIDLASSQTGPSDDPELTRAERAELLIHRCFVITIKPSDDRSPYDDRIVTQT